VSPLRGTVVEVPATVLERLGDVCRVVVDPETLEAVSRDWWPLAMIWGSEGTPVTAPAAAVRPETPADVAAVLRVCDDARVPVTAVAGRSGVCGASMPVHGGVVLDLTALSGIVDVDDTSLVLDVRAGTFGTPLEAALRTEHLLTLGHWPQSIDLSTVGGWLACRSAGQMSTRYGKIEDMVVGLDVALADGRVVHTGGAPRAAVGPDLTQLFVGSEGTLGIITGARLRVHPVPPAEVRAAFRFPSFADGLDTCRRILRRGATPAVLRLYDPVEGDRHFDTGADAIMLVLDEGDRDLVDAVLRVVLDECTARPFGHGAGATPFGHGAGATPADVGLVERWLEHRNDVSALGRFIADGFVVDTLEIAARWSDLADVYTSVLGALGAVEHMVLASAHLSHSYGDGACLYFTFGGRPPMDEREVFYRAAWDAGMRATLAGGATLTHHHGVGLNRARFVEEALGQGFSVLEATKRALDPHGVLNPGKLGLPSPWGDPAWP
jgi:alkyldihydroxyacetonephosphate synthase